MNNDEVELFTDVIKSKSGKVYTVVAMHRASDLEALLTVVGDTDYEALHEQVIEALHHARVVAANAPSSRARRKAQGK